MLEIFTYQYLLGLIIPAIIYIYFFRKKENRKIMLYSGFLYTFVLCFGFELTKLKNLNSVIQITPGYWFPKTLFNLGEITGGLAIEDILFMLISAGLVVIVFKRNGNFKKIELNKYTIYSIFFAAICSILFLYFTHKNLMYALIIFYTAGSLFLLIKNNFNLNFIIDITKSCISFGMFYSLMFFIFILIFPNFVETNYNLSSFGNNLILGIPILEILHGFAFGAFWPALVLKEDNV